MRGTAEIDRPDLWPAKYTRDVSQNHDEDRRKILDRANRMLKQSQILRKMADELLQESQDIRTAIRKVRPDRKTAKKR
jgi:hypothetical protein